MYYAIVVLESFLFFRLLKCYKKVMKNRAEFLVVPIRWSPTTGFGPINFITLGWLQKGWDHSPIYEESGYVDLLLTLQAFHFFFGFLFNDHVFYMLAICGSHVLTEHYLHSVFSISLRLAAAIKPFLIFKQHVHGCKNVMKLFTDSE